MMDHFDLLERSLDDIFLSKAERRDLKSALAHIDDSQFNSMRVRMFELARQKASPANFHLIIDWLRDTNSLLAATQANCSEAYFSPGESCRQAIISSMRAATKDLLICVFTISDDQITRAILDAHKRKVDVRIITDNDKSFDHGSDIDTLAKNGVPIKVDVTTNHMHHKFLVADRKAVLTGSYNWTNSAARFNHENILESREKDVVQTFVKEFERLWTEMSPY